MTRCDASQHEPPVLPAPIELSVVIPAYAEGPSLERLLPEVRSAVEALTCSYEILVIDTQEPLDNTSSVCNRVGVTYVRRHGGNQYGDAFRTGVQTAAGRFILCMDGDGSHSPAYFQAMWAQREASDIVIGSRYVRGGRTDNARILVWMSYALNLTFRAVFFLPVKDVTNSFRLYRRSIIAELKLVSSNFDILEEILIKAMLDRPSLRMKEIPITFAKRQAGVSKRQLLLFAASYLKTLRKLLQFRAAAKLELQRRGSL